MKWTKESSDLWVGQFAGLGKKFLNQGYCTSSPLRLHYTSVISSCTV